MPKTRYARRTKIVAPSGPANSDLATTKALFEASVDVFRLNARHGTYADQAARYTALRGMERQANHPVVVLMYLQGPKLRVGAVVDGKAELHEGQAFRFALASALGNATWAAMPHPELFAALVPDNEVLLDNGRIRLRVLSCGPDYAETTVVSSGVLSNRKGVNLPGVNLPLSTLPTKDQQGLDFGVDWIGLSFVQGPEDVENSSLDLPNQRFAACRTHLQSSPAWGVS